MKKTRYAFIIGYVALVLICILAVYAVPSIRGLMVKTYIAEQGEITISDEVILNFDRDEKVYRAKCDGKYKRLAKQGKLYRAGTKIIDLTDSSGNSRTENCYSKKPGYVIFISNKNRCTSGDALYKVVKNSKWRMKFNIEPDRAKNYYVGSKVYINNKGQDVETVVKSVKKKKDFCKVTLECGVMFDGCLTKDKMQTEIIVANSSGLLIKDESIVKKDGKKGVIIKDKMGNYIFKTISIKADDGEQCVVYQDIFMDKKYNYVETLSIYDEVLENPTKNDIIKSKQ